MLGKYLESLNKRGVILASSSAGRARVCRMIGLEPEIIPSGFAEDEDWRNFSSPEEYALFNARQKASQITSDKIVIAADTIVLLDGQVYEKPIDRDDAIKMMKALSGKTHKIITGIVLKGKILQEVVEITELEVDILSDDAVTTIADTPVEWEGHSGGYSIDSKFGSTIFKKVNGSYHNILGLPSNTIARLLIQEQIAYQNSL
jgi:septum formation protein